MFDPFPIHPVSAAPLERDVPVFARTADEALPATGPALLRQAQDEREGLSPAAAFAGREPLPPLPGAKPAATFAGGAGAFTPERRVIFCDHLSTSGNVRLACAAVRISRNTAYKARRRDPLFACAWDAAQVLARDHAEDVLADQALNGVEEPVFYRGEEVARRRRYDTRLLLAHLARLDRRCEQREAVEAAARFDELLAAIGGHAPDAAMAEAAPDIGEEHHVPGLAASRTAWVQWRMRWAEVEEEAAALEEGVPAGDAIDLAVEAGAAAREEAEAEWDAHHAAACAFVDGVGEENAEKPADPALPVFPHGQCNPCHPPLTRIGAPGRVQFVAQGKRPAHRARDCPLPKTGSSRKTEQGGAPAIISCEAGAETPPSTKTPPVPANPPFVSNAVQAVNPVQKAQFAKAGRDKADGPRQPGGGL